MSHYRVIKLSGNDKAITWIGPASFAGSSRIHNAGPSNEVILCRYSGKAGDANSVEINVDETIDITSLSQISIGLKDTTSENTIVAIVESLCAC